MLIDIINLLIRIGVVCRIWEKSIDFLVVFDYKYVGMTRVPIYD